MSYFGFRPVTHILKIIIRIYQLTLSGFIGRNCRFLPTCSEYTSVAIDQFGPWPGVWMGIARFCRCRPHGDCGFDPVPKSLPLDSKWWQPWRYGRWKKR